MIHKSSPRIHWKLKIAAASALLLGISGVASAQAVVPPVHTFSISPSANQGAADWVGTVTQLRAPGTLVGDLLYPEAVGPVNFEVIQNAAEDPPFIGENQLLNEVPAPFVATPFVTRTEFEITGANKLRTTVEYPEGPTIRRAIPIRALDTGGDIVATGWIVVRIDRIPPARPAAGDLQVLPVTNAPAGFDVLFNKQVNVFGLPIYATPGVSSEQVLHAANVWKQLMDNNRDTRADNPGVVAAMTRNQCAILMFVDLIDELVAYDLGIEVEELVTNTLSYTRLYAVDLVMNKKLQDPKQGKLCGSMQASLTLMSKGYAARHGRYFGDLVNVRSYMQALMDNARGGIWDYPPPHYPSNAWFTDYDFTKRYEVMLHDYFYWVVSTNMGANDFSKRHREVAHIFRPLTQRGLRRTDPYAHYFVNLHIFGVPRKMPTNVYKSSRPIAGKNERISWKDVLFGISLQQRTPAVDRVAETLNAGQD